MLQPTPSKVRTDGGRRAIYFNTWIFISNKGPKGEVADYFPNGEASGLEFLLQKMQVFFESQIFCRMGRATCDQISLSRPNREGMPQMKSKTFHRMERAFGVHFPLLRPIEEGML